MSFIQKSFFPILNNQKDLIYLDSSATSLKPKTVIDSINDYYLNCSANLHRGDYKNAIKADKLCAESRSLIAKHINSEIENISFTSGTTESLNMIANYLSNILKEGDEILITKAEHASNFLPFLNLVQNKKIILKFINYKDGVLDLNDLKNKLNDHTKVVSLAYITNTLGDKRDILSIRKIIGDRILIIDGAQALGHIEINVSKLGIDFLALSGHKAFASTGIGILYISNKYLKDFGVYKLGGGMNIEFDENSCIFKDNPYNLEAGTQNIEGIISMGSAIKFIDSLGINNIDNYIAKLSDYLFEQLKTLDFIEIYNINHHTGICIFNIKGVFAQDTAIFLDRYNISVRSGHHCVKTLNDIINIKNTCRISLHIYNTKEDIDKLIEVLKKKEEIYDNII